MADRDIPDPENPWVPIEDYTPEALAACEKALRTIISRIGAWGPRLILFGGLAPRYIVESPPAELERHTGTTDLDVVVGVEIGIGDEGVYTKLQQELRNAGFQESEDGSWAWERQVDGVRVVLEFFCPVEPDGRPGTLKRNPGARPDRASRPSSSGVPRSPRPIVPSGLSLARSWTRVGTVTWRSGWSTSSPSSS